jgi:hypothetical protein
VTAIVPSAAPELAFAVEDVTAVVHAVVPTLCFRLRLDAGEREVRSLGLNVQVRIDAPGARTSPATRSGCSSSSAAASAGGRRCAA